MAESRLFGADFLRAVACLTVLFHHLAQRMSWDDDLGWIEWFRFFADIGTFGVAMFFVLSGFLLARPFWAALDAGEPMPSIANYARRRAARILPGFWLALTITFVLSVTVFHVKLDGQLIFRYFAGFFLVADWHWVTFFPVEVNGPLWSIGFEVTSYVLLPFALALLFFTRNWTGRGWKSRFVWLAIIGLILGAHLVFMEYFPMDPIRRGWDYGLLGGAKLWMPNYNPFSFFAMFAVGSLAAGVQTLLARFRNPAFDALALAGIGVAVWLIHYRYLNPGFRGLGYGWLGVPYQFPWFVLVCGFVLAVTPTTVAVGRILDNRVTRYIAQISFGIYIYHYIVLELVRVWWAPDIDHGQSTDPVRFVIVSLAITGITILIAHLSFRLIENPIIQWARGRERRSPDTATLSPAAG
jgi:peptidoglycan/LPS O-acetylase OafA/YrhL